VAHASSDSHPAIVASDRSLSRRFGLDAAQIGLLLLTLAACLIRAGGLPAVQGTMGRDEARLALAGRGIVEHGLPILATGFLYTRGLLPAYLNAATFVLIGDSDQAIRLSDLIFASLLVVAVYRLGRLAGGPGPGLAAAAIVAFSPPLVLQSREAWLYSTFLFWMAMALGWLVRDGPGDRLRAALAAVAALFSHELAVLFVPVALVLDLCRLWRSRSRRSPTPGPSPTRVGRAAGSPSPARGGRGWGLGASSPRGRSVVLFWAIVLAGVAAVATLSLALRAQTLGGPTVELREYLRPTLDLRGLDVSLDILGGWHPWLLPIAALAIPVSRGGWRALLAGRGVMPSLLMAGAVIGFNSFGLVRRGESRYMLAAIPFLAIVAAVAIDRAGPAIAAVLARQRLGASTRQIVRFTLLILLVALCFDPVRLLADVRSHAVSSTWVQAVGRRGPDDLIVSFAPTLTTHYLGRTDYWLRTDGYAKYVWADKTPLQDVHTGAIVIRNQSDLEQLFLAPNRGRTAWVILAGEPAAETSRVMRELAQQLAGMAVETRRPADGRVVLKLQL
jgi:hypothetical protein